MNNEQLSHQAWADIIKRLKGVPAQTDQDCIDIIKTAIERALWNHIDRTHELSRVE